jgi:hypothetical protein
MTEDSDGFKINAIFERIPYPMTADGQGFGQLVLSISNEGEMINASEVTMAIVIPGKVGKQILPFPEGISTLKKGQSLVFDSFQPPLTRGSNAVIILTRNVDNKEIARGYIRDTP